jgi:hypothetical protein
MTTHINGKNLVEAPPPGMLEFHAAEAFRNLVRLYGFDNARAIMAEIINAEAGDRYRDR